MEKRIIKDDMSLLKYVALSIVTLNIYQFYFIYKVAKDLNYMCRKDGSKTLGLFVTLLLGIITGGVFFIVWYIISLNRMNSYLRANNQDTEITELPYALWLTLGTFIIVGPFIATHKYLQTLNKCASISNNK